MLATAHPTIRAATWLKDHGLPAVTPILHSSDYEALLTDPRLWYLRRRLGISAPIQYSAAFSIGGKFHQCFQCSDYNGIIKGDTLTSLTNESDNDLRSRLKRAKVSPEIIQDRMADEAKDRELAFALFSCATQIKTSSGTNFIDYIRKTKWKLLGREVDITMPLGHPTLLGGRLVVATMRADAIYYSESANSVWMVDPKTTGKKPEARAQKCRIEFQTQLYLDLLGAQLSLSPQERVTCLQSLPHDVILGGMVHWIIQKPTIIFGQTDRPYSWVADSKRSGIRAEGVRHGDKWEVTGQASRMEYNTESEAKQAVEEAAGVKAKKEHAGEPDLRIYINRCLDWYKDLATDSHCPVEISRTFSLDTTDRADYLKRLEFVASFLLRDPEPSNFLSNPSSCETQKGVSRWAPFLLCPHTEWPDIMARGNFIIDHRDTPQEPPTDD